MPDTRPRVQFDQHGVCNACRYNEYKQSIDWSARRKEFLELIAPYRTKANRKRSKWDCIVPWSGGKDSSSIAYKLKFEFGLNPLLVTFSPLIPNQIGMHNREELIKLGFDHLMIRPNQKISRHLARRFFIERGNQKVHWDAGVNAVPLQIALAYNIPLVFYAEHGESEYGGRVLHENSAKIRDFSEVIENQIGDDPNNWVDDIVTEKDLQPYLYPDQTELAELEVKAFYFAYFFRWSMFDNYNFIKDKINFQTAEGGRTEGTFTNFDSLDDKTDELYYHMQFVKFGFGRATRDASRMIQNNQLTREKGLEYAKLYDSEFPERYIQENLDYLSLSREELIDIIDKHRNEELWQKQSTNKSANAANSSAANPVQWSLKFEPR